MGVGELNLMRVLGHHTRANTQFAYLREAAQHKDKEAYLLCLVNLLRLLCCMTKAGLESVLSAAFSLKHETDMKKTFSSLTEVQDKAKHMRLTSEEATRCIRETPRGRFAFYDTARGEPVRPDDWRAPDFRPLIQAAQTEQGRSEVSCVFEHDDPNCIRARPMILTDNTRPGHFTFANQVGVQTGDGTSDPTSVPDELRRAIDSHLWLTNLEISSGSAPTMSSNSQLPRRPHPDGPSMMTANQLAEAQAELERAHVDQDITRMLKGDVSNMHYLANSHERQVLSLILVMHITSMLAI